MLPLEFHLDVRDLDLLDIAEFSRGLHIAFNMAISPPVEEDTVRSRNAWSRYRSRFLLRPDVVLRVDSIEHGSVKGRLTAMLISTSMLISNPISSNIAQAVGSGLLVEIIKALPDVITVGRGKHEQIQVTKTLPTSQGEMARTNSDLGASCRDAARELIGMADDLSDRGKAWTLSLTCGDVSLSLQYSGKN